MKYVAIDVETTGLDSEKNQVLQVGAVIEDTNNILSKVDIPTFNYLVKHDEYYFTNEYPLILNSWIFKELSNKNTSYNVTYADNIIPLLANWIKDNLKESFDLISEKVVIIIAGKNPSFDKKFLESLPGFNDYIHIHHRFMDPTTLFTDFKNDVNPPNLSDCKKRAGLNSVVTHDALDDAWDIVELLRTKY